ncbi:MAG: hypothetical protein GEU78_09715 [Actinobacteria bacterium]|nr:hypothetical protein [Actinomycetota bacterium]
MALRMKVTYLDGREEVVTILPPIFMAAEKHFKRDGGLSERNKVASTYYMTWQALQKFGREENDFDAFLELIEEIEDAEDEAEDPTGPAPQPDESSS